MKIKDLNELCKEINIDLSDLSTNEEVMVDGVKQGKEAVDIGDEEEEGK